MTLMALFSRGYNAYLSRRNERLRIMQTRMELQRLTDDQLADIGLTRGRIAYAAQHGLPAARKFYGDPQTAC
ncbi:MAG: DUF1127 domain-containing protein [Azospirillaceae bacterium]